MSSDILSRELSVADFGLIFAGAQKNIAHQVSPWSLSAMIC